MPKLFYIFSILFILGNTSCFSQNIGDAIIAKDTIIKDQINPLAPSKAAFYSANSAFKESAIRFTTIKDQTNPNNGIKISQTCPGGSF